MPERSYNGPVPAVDVHLPDGTVKTCNRGETVSLPADVAASLDLSGDWKTPKSSKSAQAGKE